MTAPRGRFLASLAAVLLLLSGAAARALPAPASSTLLKVSTRVEPRAAGALLIVDAELASGWHVNSHVPSEDYLIATSVRVDPAAGVRAGEAKYPEGRMKKFSFAEKPLSVYEGTFTLEVPLTFEGAGPSAVTGSVEFQACNDTQCLAPASVPFRASLSGSGEDRKLSGGAVPLSQAPGGGEQTTSTAAAGASRDFGQLLERRGFPVVLLLLFAGGLALNLTPCVYPVIPLTVSFFGGQAKGETGRVFGLATLYVLGMATTYSALGVAAGLSGKLFGAALQSPWVLAGVAAVLVALALSMFGLYDIRMPTALMQKTGARSGRAGAYAMGLLVGVVAAPCVGPFVLGLLAFVAARQNAGLGFLFFFVLSLGLGLPYLFLAAFSGSLSRLPRAGEWMEGVKSVFGWVLLAMAAYFLRTAVPRPAGDWLLPAVLVAGAVTLAVRRASLRPAARAAAALVFLAAAIFFVPRRAAAAPEWRPFTESEVSRAGRPAVIDFSAAWCVPCRELDEKTFSDPRVREALGKRALFKADMTKSASPEVVALAERYSILGVPTLVFLDAGGREKSDLRLIGFEGPDAFLKRLDNAP
ncbi:MAG TPA: cytochrome c biogenesis protein CcdA [Thermoanaerobaculia bacterium]|nr:cytochrome c biogenesis protein CcdA [Thermoanaerobaculia bacterium]